MNDFNFEEGISFTRTIQCTKCGHEENVNLADYFAYEDSNERPMGLDKTYYFDSEDNYICPICGKVVHIEGWICEYPIGAYDSEDINVK